MENRVLKLCIILVIIKTSAGLRECSQRNYNKGSVVCVCNETYCDQLPSINDEFVKGKVNLYESNKDGLRFKETNIDIENWRENSNPGQVKVSLHKDTKYQKIIGFGGAFTDATGINIYSLPENMRETLLADYFSKHGAEYNMGRVPIAGTDFSTRPYTYDDTPNDFNLTFFKLADEDFKYKIPLIKRAQSLNNVSLYLFASAWSSPPWTKTNRNIRGGGRLRGEPNGLFYRYWAKYYVRFLDEYKKHGINYWGLTTGNEPKVAFTEYRYNGLEFTPYTQRDFLKLDLGPVLNRAGYTRDLLNIMIMDDNIELLPKWPYIVLSDEDANKFVKGVAFHWYANQEYPRFVLNWTHSLFPSYFLLSTEACEGFRLKFDPEKVMLGSWKRGENYGIDIIEDLNNWSSGWVDWNMALDMKGGPNWSGNNVDSPIIVNAESKEYYKQPMFYVLSHFSKFLTRNSVRIEFEVESKLRSIYVTSFLNSNNNTVVIVLNANNYDVDFVIKSDSNAVRHRLTPKSIQTFIGNF